MRPQTPKSDKVPHVPRPKVQPNSDIIVIKKVVNTLPYACMVEIDFPSGYDTVYYAAMNDKGDKLFYKSERPTDILPSFSAADLKTEDSHFTFICWPVKAEVIGKPTTWPGIETRPNLKIGRHELQVDFSAEDHIYFDLLKPIIEKHYGKCALAGTVKVESGSYDIYLPSYNKIKLSSDKRNLIHELIHANRKQLLFANKGGRYHQETEMIEEFFAEGVANMVKDELNRSPNSYLIAGAVYGSTLGYNYDFRVIDPSIMTQDLQSTRGGILNLETCRYYLASEAYHKVALEYFMNTNRQFGRDFNEQYYRILSSEKRDPSREMFFEICQRLLPALEGIETGKWLGQQNLFACEYTEGEKIYMEMNDYPMHDEWLGISQFYCYETFSNGSDWAIGEKRYSKNGTPLAIEVKEVATGRIIFSKTCLVSDYPNGFGFVKIYFYHKEDSPGVAHFAKQDQQGGAPYEMVLVSQGLYKINVRSQNAERTYYRFMGETMYQHRDKLVFAYPDSDQDVDIKLRHHTKDGRVVESRQLTFENKMCVVDLPIIENQNSAPGLLTIHLNEGGKERSIQRNIGYGGSHGGHQFLLQPSEIKDLLA